MSDHGENGYQFALDCPFLSHLFVEFGVRGKGGVFPTCFILLWEYTTHSCITSIGVQSE